MTVERGPGLESDQETPWSALGALLRAGLMQAAPRGAVPAGAVGVLAGVAPDVGTGATVRPPGDRGQVAGALAALLRTVAASQPVGLCVDGADSADPASLDALRASVSQLEALPVVLVLTSGRAPEPGSRALEGLKGEIGRGLPGAVVELEPLTEAETRELVLGQSPWCTSEGDRDRLARRVFQETQGNPFLIVTLLRGLASASVLRKEVVTWPPPGGTTDSPLPIDVPSLLRRAVVARITELDHEHQSIIRAAAVGGLAIDGELVAALTELPLARVEDGLAVLEQHRLVAFRGGRFTFAAPLVAHVVRGEWLLPGQRRTLVTRAVAVLRGRADLESRLLLAELLADGGPAAEGFDAAAQLAREAAAAGKGRTARHALHLAERSVPAGDEIRRRALDVLRAQLVASVRPVA